MKEQPPVLPAAMRRINEGGSGMTLKLKFGGSGAAVSPGEDADAAAAQEFDEDDYDDDGYDDFSSPEPPQQYASAGGTEKLMLPLRLGGAGGGGGRGSTPAVDPAVEQGVKDDVDRRLALATYQVSRDGSRTPGTGGSTPLPPSAAEARQNHHLHQTTTSSTSSLRGGTPANVPILPAPPAASSSRPPLLPASHAASAAASPSAHVVGQAGSVSAGGRAAQAGAGTAATATPSQVPRAPVQTVKPRDRVLAKVVSPESPPSE
jgi:hypothetical protein